MLSLLDHMATNYRRTRVRLPGPVRPRVERLGRFRLGVYMNRAAYLATQPVRKAVRRYRHRHGEAGPAMDRYRLPGSDTAAKTEQQDRLKTCAVAAPVRRRGAEQEAPPMADQLSRAARAARRNSIRSTEVFPVSNSVTLCRVV